MNPIVKFIEKNHKYVSVDPNDGREWTSVTTAVSKFKPPFEKDRIAEKCSKNKKSKWYGNTPEQIKELWEKESKYATDLGSWYHNQRERDILEFSSIEREGIPLPIYNSTYSNDGEKYAPEQKLTPGIYPEHFVYLKSAGICGQVDRAEVVKGYVNIYDYKTNKEIKTESYQSWDGSYKMMLPPLDHIMDCNYYHYALQLSMYMYIILKHNPKLKPGKMQIDHIVFKSSYDEYGNRKVVYDENNNPIIQEIVTYDLPYLVNEVKTIIEELKK